MDLVIHYRRPTSVDNGHWGTHFTEIASEQKFRTVSVGTLPDASIRGNIPSASRRVPNVGWNQVSEPLCPAILVPGITLAPAATRCTCLRCSSARPRLNCFIMEEKIIWFWAWSQPFPLKYNVYTKTHFVLRNTKRLEQEWYKYRRGNFRSSVLFSYPERSDLHSSRPIFLPYCLTLQRNV
jgi:hypothetical protein